MDRVDVSVVLVAFNNREVTKNCLRSIEALTQGLTYEIIVVDNGSSDATVEEIRKEFPRVLLIENGANLGFAKAQNIGMRRSRGRHVLIMNNDITLEGNAIRGLLDHLTAAGPATGVVGPMVLESDGRIAPSGRRCLMSPGMTFAGLVNRHFNYRRFLPEALMRDTLGWLLRRWHDNYEDLTAERVVEFVDGMCLLVRREVLEAVGLFDEQFFFDFEIMDLSDRIRKGGWLIRYFPGARVVHHRHSTRKKVPRILIETHRSELIYTAKRAPRRVPSLRRWTQIVVRVRLAWTGLLAWAGVNRSTWPDTARILREVIRVARTFDARKVPEAERIPRL